jgi:hypothetical protein
MWGTPSTIADPMKAVFGVRVRAVLSSSNVLHIAWIEDQTNNTFLAYSLRIEQGSQIVQVTPTPVTGMYSLDMDISAEGVPYLVWHSGTNQTIVYLAVWNSETSEWQIETKSVNMLVPTEILAAWIYLEYIIIDQVGTIHLFVQYLYADMGSNYWVSTVHFKQNGETGEWGSPNLIFLAPQAYYSEELSEVSLDSNGILYAIRLTNIQSSSTTTVYKYENETWSIALTLLKELNQVVDSYTFVKGRYPEGLLANSGLLGIQRIEDYIGENGTSAYLFKWIPSSSSSTFEIFYNENSQGSEESNVVFIPSTTKTYIHRLIGIKNVSGYDAFSFWLSSSTSIGVIDLALGESIETISEALQHEYTQTLKTSPVANNEMIYIWVRWKAPAPWVAGHNSIQLNIQIF